MTLLCVFVFSACGAKVSTRLYIDSDFKGSRTITAVLAASDLNDNVTGGADAIESVVKKYIPGCMTYTHVPDDGETYSHTVNEGDLCYTFTFEFSSLEDYKKKAEEILRSDPNNDFTPEISFENVSSPFKQSLYLSEDFSSVDLLDWLTYGLQTEGIVTHSSVSDWYESSYNTVVFDGTEYSSSNKLSLDNSEYSCPESIAVSTRLNADGTIDRSFDFTFTPDTVTKLAEKDVDLDSYFSGLSASAQMSKPENDYGYNIYRLEVKGLTAEAVASETAKILADENAAFSLSVVKYVPDENASSDYDVQIDVSESMSGQYYLRKSPGELTSKYYFPGNVGVIDSPDIYLQSSYDENDERYYYYNYPQLEEGKNPVFRMGWKLDFDSVGAEISFSSDKPSLKINMGVPAGLMDAAKTPLREGIEAALPDGAEFSEETSDDGALAVFKADMSGGSAEDVANRFKQFIYAYTGNKVECSFRSGKALSGSLFKNVSTHSAVFDMSSLTADNVVNITYNTSIGEKVYISESGSFTADGEQEQGSFKGTSGGYVRLDVVNETVNVAGIIVFVVIIASAVLFAVIAAANAKSWLGLFKSVPKPAVQSDASAVKEAPAPEKAAAPVSSEAQSSSESKSSEESHEDEEEFI